MDNRFSLVKRGTSKYVEWLGINENPYTTYDTNFVIQSGSGWATAKMYGYHLLSLINEINSKGTSLAS